MCLSLLLAATPVIYGQAGQSDADAGLSERERALLNRIDHLEARLAALEAEEQAKQAPPVPALHDNATAQPASTLSTGGSTGSPGGEGASEPGILGGLGAGATLNLYMDGYWGYNFNRPEGRVNLLRSNDVLHNNFTVNQVGLIFERAPDVAAGRRFGIRADLMFGQNTETLQGGAQNEPRPQIYRNIFQAYGSYVFPVGSGLTVDFGKFASSLGLENNYAYEGINYSRSFFFDFLPFYHTGVRTTYNINDKMSVQNWLVNGTNQTEDFNGFKSTAALLTLRPTKSLVAQVNYYVGQEGRDLTTNLIPSLPNLPTEPGFSFMPVPGRTPNGRTHILDTYATLSATNKLTFAGEFDYVIARTYDIAAPARVTGGAAYAKYQLSPKWSAAGRFEVLNDRGGLFGGITQTLKETTTTATYQPIDGVQMRLEWRRDFSNAPFFLTSVADLRKKEQNTATVGLIWWLGGKKESW